MGEPIDTMPHTWQPYQGQRHAYPGGRRTNGTPVVFLCGRKGEAAGLDSDLCSPPRLWWTCRDCYREARDRQERRHETGFAAVSYSS
ncbi:hypothetical protein GCM10012275_37100 [Longimycelium tulufanense]|uniref:Uncharacterized protein n=1 Tax=Longimycelium tulufanense TaxID=907463 RepID=A0A8J3CA16_9PSEU|nr:hypothetical protein [Longimycelium tulufanense]GGM63008.1 hypothetical protein GCM10012275_37100 [Longimycelium tulufanense]